jgi:hypothetical protein
MRFLTRLLKTPNEDQEEDLDEFDAEENGLLMIRSLSGDREGPTPAGRKESWPTRRPRARPDPRKTGLDSFPPAKVAPQTQRRSRHRPRARRRRL